MSKKKKKTRVLLIFGGTSQERKVALSTGKTIAGYLDPDKYEVTPIEIAKEGKWLIATETIKQIGKKLKTKKVKSPGKLIPLERGAKPEIDVALLALHGPGGEDGTIQGMLELFNIPYTCSGVLASSLAMDKARAKRFVASAGIPVLPHVVVQSKNFHKNKNKILSKLKGLVVIKPVRLGSSLGVTITKGRENIAKGIREAFRQDEEVMIEPFIIGREITVPVLGNSNPKALPTIEIIPWDRSTFYDYEAKYEEGGSEHLIPAPLSKPQEKQVTNFALQVHKILGCRGVTRSDFMLDKSGRFYFLEINTIPGMTPTSLVPQSALAAGISYKQLLDKLIDLAQAKD